MLNMGMPKGKERIAGTNFLYIVSHNVNEKTTHEFHKTSEMILVKNFAEK